MTDIETNKSSDELDEFIKHMNDFIKEEWEESNNEDSNYSLSQDEDEVETDDDDIYDDEEEEDINEEEEESSLITFEQSLAFLDDMVGMEHVKQKLLRLGRYVQWKQKLEAVGIDTSKFPTPNLTFMFLGDPGTGKTTVAKQMGNVLHSLGLISSNEVMEFRREDLVGQNYGSEEENTKEALRRTFGKVFFLDEAYQCFKNGIDKRDPGYHILDTLMADFGSDNRCIIMAGYKAEMQELFNVNPGFRSRIPDENIIEFTRPSEQLLVDVATNAFDKMEFFLDPKADDLLRQYIHDLWTSRERDFGNARAIRQLTDSVVINHANRIMTTTKADDFIITHDDIRQSLIQQPVKKITRAHVGFV